MTEAVEPAESVRENVPSHVEDTVQAVARFHAAHEADASPLQRFVETATRRAGRPSFIALMTAVIAGIYEETLNNDVTKVPFLGDIPYLGYLFKTTNKNIEKTELLIFLTPRIVKESVTAVR